MADNKARLLDHAWFVAIPVLTLFCGLALTFQNLHTTFPQVQWLHLNTALARQDISSVIAFYSALPRVAVALLGGAGLGLSGAILQRVLRNPLADPSVLGVSAGAYLAVVLAVIAVPGLQLPQRMAVAVFGAALSIALIMAIGWRRGASPVALSLAGLTVNLIFGSLASMIVTFRRDSIVSLALWGAGALRQNDWTAAQSLALGLVPAVIATIPLSRMLALFSLGDGAIASLGLSASTIRLLFLGLAAWIAGLVAASIGMIGFVGLCAPWLARLCGARRVGSSLATAALLGAGLVLITDQLLIMLGPRMASLPAGSLTALIGAPVLLWILRKPVFDRRLAPQSLQTGVSRREKRPAYPIMIVGTVVVGIALFGTHDAHGWSILDLCLLHTVWPWRWPRLMGAAASGAALAIAGTVLQRTTANPMASPELLGTSSGAVIGAVAAQFIFMDASPLVPVVGASAGATIVIVLVLWFAKRAHHAPDHTLLVGLGFGAALSAVANLLVLIPDPRLQSLQIWMMGSTSQLQAASASIAAVVAIAGLGLALLAQRWLTLLPVGTETAVSLGMSVHVARPWLLLLTSVLTSVATLNVGPLSFIGLIAPHLAHAIGGAKASSHLLLAAFLGGMIMMLADWLGRTVMFPYEIPAGLLATCIGAPYFLWLMWRSAN